MINKNKVWSSLGCTTFLFFLFFQSTHCKEADTKEFSCPSFKNVNITASMSSDQIIEKLVTLSECTKVVFAAGNYNLNRTLFIEKNGVLLLGAGMDRSILNFAALRTGHGVHMKGKLVGIADLTILDAKKNALRIEESERVLIKRVKTDWSNTKGGTRPGMKQNGDYGLYPVKSKKVLVEDSVSYGASDAGIYVGKSIDVIVRRNIAKFNVAGIEIENTSNASVYDNLAENNTGGLLIFDNPGNKEVGKNIRVYKNRVLNNNITNFCNAGVVCEIPAGTGGLVLAVRRVEFFDNIFENNNTVDLAIINGLALTGFGNLLTNWPSLNFRSHDIYIHNNKFGGKYSGDEILEAKVGQPGPLNLARPGEDNDRQQLAQALQASLQALSESTAPSVILDGIDFLLIINSKDNTNNICVRNNANFIGILDLNLPENENLLGDPAKYSEAAANMRRLSNDLGDYNCDGFSPKLPSEKVSLEKVSSWRLTPLLEILR